MKKIVIAAFAFLFVLSSSLYAQERAITGKVTDASNGDGIPGVNILVVGTTNGTITDMDGNYTITVPADDASLQFSFTGYSPQTIAVAGKSVIDVNMEPSDVQLEGVVITALGIQKKSNALTYSTQKVDGEELTRAKDVNMINSLSGKTAGLVIGRSSSGLGGSSRVIIRGNKSISNANQPLYVIDGVPMNNSSMGQIGGSQLSGTVDGGDAISNINPDDIKSINILKGASASALYGSLGQNGVVLIETKKGQAGKTVVDFSSSTAFESVLLVPEVQGTYGATSTLNPSSDENDPTTWGAADNGAISSDELKDFFKTGVTSINSISISTGNDKNQFYLSYANTSGKGVVEKNKLSKNNIYVKGNSKIYDNLTVEGSANLIKQTVENRPYTGFESNPALEAYLYPGSKSAFSALKDNYSVWNPSREIYVQNYPYAGYNSGSYILDNPYWTINKNPNTLERVRTIFNGSLKWDISQSLNFQVRGSYDRIDDQFEQHVYATSSRIVYDQKGEYNLQKNTTSQFYSDFLLSFNKPELGDFSLSAVLGNSNNYFYGYQQMIQTINGQNNMFATNVFSLTNLQGAFVRQESSVETLTQSIFGTATLGFKEMLFLDVTGRNEWASTISNESFFYPSVGGTFILSEVTGTNDVFNFMKLRATYSEVGNALPYGVNNKGTRLYYTMMNGSPEKPLNGLAPSASNPEEFITLKPERSKSIELGTNIRLFNSSVDLDFTYYSNNVENQFFTVAAPIGAYVPNFLVNAGEVKNSGIEIMLSYRLANQNGLNYKTSLNFAHNKNEVVSVNDEAGIESYTITRYANTKIAEIRVVKGGEFGDLYAPTFQRDASGRVILGTSAENMGQPLPTTEYVKVGNANSPITLGWSNTFTYKGLTFNFLIDGRIGGDVISLTEANLDANGRSQRSADDRNAGQVVFEGEVVATGTAAVEAWYRGLSGIGSNYVYDATNFRVREISLGYKVPVDFSNGVLKNLYLSVYGKNLFFLYKDAPFDPEVSAASTTGLQGIEAFSLPSTRSFGFSLKATF